MGCIEGYYAFNSGSCLKCPSYAPSIYATNPICASTEDINTDLINEYEIFSGYWLYPSFSGLFFFFIFF